MHNIRRVEKWRPAFFVKNGGELRRGMEFNRLAPADSCVNVPKQQSRFRLISTHTSKSLARIPPLAVWPHFNLTEGQNVSARRGWIGPTGFESEL